MYVSRVATEWATALKEGNFPLAPTPSGGSENVSTTIRGGIFFIFSKKRKYKWNRFVCWSPNPLFTLLVRFSLISGVLPVIYLAFYSRFSGPKKGIVKLLLADHHQKHFHHTYHLPPVNTSIKCQHHNQFNKNVRSKLMMVSNLVSRSGLKFVSLKVTLINYQLSANNNQSSSQISFICETYLWCCEAYYQCCETYYCAHSKYS